MSLKQISSLPITGQKEAASSGSTKPIATGLVTLSSSQQSQAVARLVEVGSPYQVNAKVISCVESSVPLAAKYDSNHNLKDFRYQVQPHHWTDDQRAAAHDAYGKILKSTVPLPTSDIEQRLTVLTMFVTLGKDFDDEAIVLKVRALAQELARYPADIAIAGIEHVKKTCKFWPSLAEFHEVMEPMYWPRKQLLRRLQKCIE